MAVSFPMPIRSPVPFPDITVCDKVYGENLFIEDCMRAANSLPSGSMPVRYPLNSGSTRGIVQTFGGCSISVSEAGPISAPNVAIIPNLVRQIAGWLIRSCVASSRGVGGFTTLGLERLATYSVLATTDYWDPFPNNVNFLTITVGGLGSQNSRPGNTDPGIPLALAEFQWSRMQDYHARPNSDIAKMLETNSAVWISQAERMYQGGSVPWWQIPSQTSEMTYECDPGLGSPSIADCTRIESSQLGPPSDTVALHPGATTFFHLNTCYFAISATASLVVNWNQIRAALLTLLNVCVRNPLQPPKGGRAHWGAPPKQLSGMRKRQGNQNALTGWNALPPHVNITIFKQSEQWKDPIAELQSCTWKAITNGVSISTC